uniref:F-box protein 2 n=1 Tax=Cyprinus carpio carpio TaxID=630221 RepID=A0A9J7YFA6_CYPCA
MRVGKIRLFFLGEKGSFSLSFTLPACVLTCLHSSFVQYIWVFQCLFLLCSRLCMKRQVIDLLAEGYDPENLDIAQPAVNVEDWFCSRADCGCIYMLTVTLLDENLEVIEEFKPDEVTLDPDSDDCSWKQVSHTFTDYGPGLRFISFAHGGQDTKYWKGWFGVRVTGSSVTVDL